MISTKGRYSIRILLDLAEHGSSGGYTPMKEVAVRQDISLKYIERILPPLKNAGLIASTHGIGGGYRLTRRRRIIPSGRFSASRRAISRRGLLTAERRALLPRGRVPDAAVWQGYYKLTEDYFSGITLADLMNVPLADNYVI